MGGDKPRPYEIEASNISRNQIMPVGAGFIPARIGENKKMTEHKKLQPEIRFAGFTDDWEQRKLGEVVNVLDNLRIPIAASQRLEGVTPYYGANGIQGYIDGFTHDGEFVLVAEDGANDLINYPVQYVSGKVWINNHAHVLQGIKNVANNLFLVYRIKSMDMTKYLVGGGRTKLNASVMKDIELHLPNYAEQTQIGNFFKQLDDTIALHQRELEKFKILKTSYLENIFLGKVSLFTAKNTITWEQRKLGECFNERTERSSIGELISVTMNSGVIKASDLDRKDNSSKDKSNYKKVEIGDIAYNSMRMWQGSSGESTFRGILSPAYTVLIPNKDISSTFFSYYFKLERMLEIFKVNSQGLTSDTWNLKYPTIAKIVVSVPTLKEQIQIGNFFKQLDDTIALHQKELTKYQQIKASCLEKMFVE